MTTPALLSARQQRQRFSSRQRKRLRAACQRKVAWPTHALAQAEAARLSLKYCHLIQAYECRWCGLYHTGSQLWTADQNVTD